MARKKQPKGNREGTHEEQGLVGAALVEAVENQLRDNDPPITARTLERLKGEGYSREEAIDLIVVALSAEIWAIQTSKRRFDLKNYTTLLESLPGLATNAKPGADEVPS